MVWVISIWLSVSMALGMSAHAVLDPHDMLTSTLLFALPLAIFGLQERFRSPHASYRLLGIDLFSSASPYRQATLWGIPIGRERVVVEGSGKEHDLSEHVLVMLRAFLPTVVNVLVARLPRHDAPDR